MTAQGPACFYCHKPAELVYSGGAYVCQACGTARVNEYATRGAAGGEIKFYDSKAPFHELTNFFPCCIMVDGRDYRTSEHYFQAAKFFSTAPAVAEAIRAVATPMDAWKTGRENKHMAPDWDTTVRDEIMLKVLRLKFASKYMKNVLLATCSARLVLETHHDEYWGCVSSGKGRNRLGEMLAQIRSELRAKTPPPAAREPGLPPKEEVKPPPVSVSPPAPQPPMPKKEEVKPPVPVPPMCFYCQRSLADFKFSGGAHVCQPCGRAKIEGYKAVVSAAVPGQSIEFYERIEPFCELTNFFPCMLVVDGVEYPTAEHYFLAARFFVSAPYVAESIRKCALLSRAYDLVQLNKKDESPDWEKDRDLAMAKVLRSKFSQSYLKQVLLATGDMRLALHTNDDPYWGDGLGNGKNKLGELLMNIRRELQPVPIAPPPPAAVRCANLQCPCDSVTGKAGMFCCRMCSSGKPCAARLHIFVAPTIVL